jgi:hypothetical protein
MVHCVYTLHAHNSGYEHNDVLNDTLQKIDGYTANTITKMHQNKKIQNKKYIIGTQRHY